MRIDTHPVFTMDNSAYIGIGSNQGDPYTNCAVAIKHICSPEKKDACTTTIFQESTTSGIRYYQADRIKLIRKTKVITTPYGRLSVKVFTTPSGGYFASPEYEECKKIAKKKGIPLKKVYLELTQLLPPLNTKFRL